MSTTRWHPESLRRCLHQATKRLWINWLSSLLNGRTSFSRSAFCSFFTRLHNGKTFQFLEYVGVEVCFRSASVGRNILSVTFPPFLYFGACSSLINVKITDD